MMTVSFASSSEMIVLCFTPLVVKYLDIFNPSVVGFSLVVGFLGGPAGEKK